MSPDRIERFGDALIKLPPDETIQAVFSRLRGPDGKGGQRAMDWQTVARYGRIRGRGEFKGTYHDEHEVLPL